MPRVMFVERYLKRALAARIAEEGAPPVVASVRVVHPGRILSVHLAQCGKDASGTPSREHASDVVVLFQRGILAIAKRAVGPDSSSGQPLAVVWYATGGYPG